MNKLFTKIAALTLGVAMAAGVGVAVGATKASPVKAAEALDTSYDLTNNVPDGLTASVSLTKDSNNRGMGKAGATYTLTTSKSFENVTKIVVNAATNYGTFANHSISATVGGSAFGSAVNFSAKASTDYEIVSAAASGAVVVSLNNSAEGTTKTNTIWCKTIEVYTNSGGSTTYYTVTDNVEHGTLDKTSVAEGSTLVATITPDAGYVVPESVSVQIGGEPSQAFTYSAGVVTIENVTDNVIIAGTCPAAPSPEHAGTLEDPYTVADAFLAIDNGTGLANVYATGIVSQIVTPWSDQFKNITFNISADGTTDGQQLQAYRCASSDAHPIASDADIEVGATVILTGTLKKYNSTYEFNAGCTVASYTAPVHVDPGITLSNSYHFFLVNDAAFNVTVTPNEVFAGTPTLSLAAEPEHVQVAIDGLSVTVTPVSKGNDNIIIVATYDTQVAQASFVSIVDPISVAEAHALLSLVPTAVLQGAYVEGIVSQIDSYSDQYHSIYYWISDDGTTTDQFYVYSGKGLEGADFNSAEDIVVGAHVVVNGTIKTYNETHEFDKNNILISYVVPTPPAEKTLESISVDVTGAKTSYEVGEEFDTTGIVVTAHYNDETTADVSAIAEYAGFDSSATVAEQVITVSYLEGEVTKTTSFNVEIVEPAPAKTDWTKEEKDLFAERFEGFRDVPFCPEINDFAWNEQYSMYILTPEGDISEAVATAFADWTNEQSNYYSDFTEHGYVVLENYSGSYYLYWQQAAWFDEQILDFQEKLDGYVPTFNPALLDFEWNANLNAYTLGGFYDNNGYYQYYVGEELVSEDGFSAVEGAENVYYRYTTNGTVYLACIIQQSGESTVFGAQLWYVKDPIPTSLQLDTSAVKLDYYVGQEFDATGLVVNVLDENGEVMYNGQNVAEYCTFVYDFSEAGQATVTVNLAAVSLSATIDVTVAENPYDAEAWAEEFLAAIQNVCANYDGKKNNAKALADVWKVFKDNDHYGALSDEEQAILRTTAADQKGSTIAKALAFYDYACKKYGLEKFIGGRTVKAVAFEVETPTTSNRNALIAIAIVSFVAVTGVGLTIVIRRRKATNVK